jgi:glycine/D-amino acid oxidase-like deaminating enzyme
LSLAQDIINLKDIEIIDIKVGARSCSVDYFPMVGELIDSKASIEKYPHLINGSFVTDDKLIKKKNLYIINGVGGRGFVLSPYLANSLVEFLMNKKVINESILTNRLFKRWVKKIKLNNR